jgi:hypothetical protein
VTKSRLAQLFSILRTIVPTQRDSRLRVDERRCRRVRLLAAACSSTGSQPFELASVSCLLLWLRRTATATAGERRRVTATERGRPRWKAEGEGAEGEGKGDRPWRAAGDSEHPRRRATTTEGWGNRHAKVRGEHMRELATIEHGRGRAEAREGGRECGGEAR